MKTWVNLWYLIAGFTILNLQLQCEAVTEDDFFSYGSGTSDGMVVNEDDANGAMVIPSNISYPFYGRNAPSEVYASVNGIITFSVMPGFYLSNFSFPRNFTLQSIAVFFADSDLTGAGTMWYRISTTDTVALQKASEMVRNSFVTMPNFEALSVVVVTWDGIGYYNARTDKLNSYQCIIVTDSKHTFVILMYAAVEWLMAMNSSFALVGFNAGDLETFYNLPQSGTMDLPDLSLLSNILIPGTWIYQISGRSIVPGGCSNSSASMPLVSLMLHPSYGSELGGTLVSVQGHCFLPQHNILCSFGGTRVAAIYVNGIIAHCIVPPLSQRGRISFQLFIDGVLRGESVYTSLSIESTYVVDLTPSFPSSFPALLSNSQSVALTWDPASVVPGVELNVNTFNLDLLLYTMDMTSGLWQMHTMLAENVPNSGTRTVILPELNLSNDVQPLAIYLGTTLSTSARFGPDLLISTIYRSKNRIGVWTSQYYYLSSNLTNHRDLCDDWYGMETVVSNITITCPPTKIQAQLPNSGLVETNFTSFSGKTAYGNQWLTTFHPGAASCFKEALIIQRSAPRTPTQQECCYNNRGELITGAPNGGAVNKVAVDFNPLEHFKEDKRPYIICCTTTYPNCGHYYDKRPSSKGNMFNPILPAWLMGDPHFITLDGFHYTFNGYGEFTLIQTLQGTFTLQGRMEQLQGNPSASTFSALTAQVGRFSERILILTNIAGPDIGGMDIYLNDTLISSNYLPEETFDGFVLRTNGSHDITVQFANGIYLECRTSSMGLMTTVIVGVPSSFKNIVSGLLGNFNGDNTDDLTPAGTSVPLDISSNLRTIHNLFGVSWLLKEISESLFTYFPYQNFSLIRKEAMEPIFNVAENSQFNNRCLGDPFCVYDRTVTGSEEFALETLATTVEVRQVESLSNLVLCNPVCENGVCLPNNECACSAGFTGSRCQTIIVENCDDSGPCLASETCELHAGSYMCSCPSDPTGILCRPTTGDGSSEGIFSNTLYVTLIAVAIGVAGGIILSVVTVAIMVVVCRKVHRHKSQSKTLVGSTQDIDNKLNTGSRKESTVSLPPSYSELEFDRRNPRFHHTAGNGIMVATIPEDGHDYADIPDSNYQNIQGRPPVPVRRASLGFVSHIHEDSNHHRQQLPDGRGSLSTRAQSHNVISTSPESVNIEGERQVYNTGGSNNVVMRHMSQTSLQDHTSHAWYRSSTPSMVSGERGDILQSQLTPTSPTCLTPPTPSSATSDVPVPSASLPIAYSKSSTLPNSFSQPSSDHCQHIPPPSSSASMPLNVSSSVIHRPLKLSQSNPGSGSTRTSSRQSNSLQHSIPELDDADMPATDV